MGSAETIARDHALGSLEAGKLADLVILNVNPLTDIKNTLDIRHVMKNGRLYDPGTLAEADETVNH
jgi:imidazolonepropionase-like amidohydrolase